MYYLADPRLKTASDRYPVEMALMCRTLYQIYRLYKQGLVTESVGKEAEKLLAERCAKELIELIAPTVD